MSKILYKKFRATITYKIETTEDFIPKVKDEEINWKEIVRGDPEIVGAKVEVQEV